MGVQKWGKEDTTTSRKIVFNWGNRKRVDRVVKHSNHHLEDYSKIALLYILLFIITQFLLPPYKKGTYFSTFLMYFTFQMNVWLYHCQTEHTTLQMKSFTFISFHHPIALACMLRMSNTVSCVNLLQIVSLLETKKHALKFSNLFRLHDFPSKSQQLKLFLTQNLAPFSVDHIPVWLIAPRAVKLNEKGNY